MLEMRAGSTPAAPTNQPKKNKRYEDISLLRAGRHVAFPLPEWRGGCGHCHPGVEPVRNHHVSGHDGHGEGKRDNIE